MRIEVVVKKTIDVAYDVDVDEIIGSFEYLNEIVDDAYRIEEEIVSVVGSEK